MDTMQLIAKVIEVAQNASDAILEIYRDVDVGVRYKSDNSPLTLADLAADRVIRSGLAALDPVYPILTEETVQITYEHRKDWYRFWLVDPLDGTKEFIKRSGEFTVNIALIENGMPILGVVYVPVSDLCYYATIDSGAYLQEKRQSVRRVGVKALLPGEAVSVVMSRSHADWRTEAMLHYLGRYECISMGSSLKLCAVADGSAHFYPRLGPTMEWDTAAAHAIVLAAGGCVCDAAGNELRYNKPDLHNPDFFVLPKNSEMLMNAARQSAIPEEKI